MVALTEKVAIGNPTSFPEMAQFATIEEPEEALEDFDEFTGPTADDLRREAEMFKSQWEDEKDRMFASARAEAESIVTDAQKAAFAEVKRQTDEGQVIKQQAIEEAERIVADAQDKVRQLENEIRQTLEAERNDARTQGKSEGKDSGFAEGKAEVDRLIERTQTVLERAQDKRGEILSETEKEIVDLVLLITRKVIKVISENQRDIIIYNVTEALRKVKAKGSVIIRVNLKDLELATEHKQDFINIMEGKGSVNIAEDSSVDPGGCIIETDFGEIDARIASQLAELENKILEISPIGSRIKDNTPPPIVKTASLNSELAAASTLLQTQAKSAMDTSSGSIEEDDLDSTLSHGAEAALTASAALAALATMATKGKRESDRKVAEKLENMSLKRKTDP